MSEETIPVSGSFRDPAGFLFWCRKQLFRQINSDYLSTYQKFISSGLYNFLTESDLLISHEETYPFGTVKENTVIIKPERIPMISYPYEWSFSQLKDAALLTLEIQSVALKKGMILKDASAYNVQFHKGKPIFIDTLSFETYQEGTPWKAYRQFCQHFMAPLLLMKYYDSRLNQLSKIYIDGIPLDLASKLLPLSSRFNLSCILHIHTHSKLQNKYQHNTKIKQSYSRFTCKTLQMLNQSLINAVSKINQKTNKTEWENYYSSNNNYSNEALQEKESIIDIWLSKLKPRVVWDLGANIGRFSQIASRHSEQVIAWDIDPNCVDSHYKHNRNQARSNILPLILDLTNPSPGIGWAHQERQTLMDRGPVDLVLALGLIHHLAIVNNLPLIKIADFFSKITEYLLLEFIPKTDSQVVKLLSTREDIFLDYSLENTKMCFSSQFILLDEYHFKNSKRTLLLYKLNR